MHEVLRFLQTNEAYFLIGLSVASFLLLIYSLVLSRRLARINRRRNAKLEDGRVGEIIDFLTNQSDSLARLEARVDEMGARQVNMDRELGECLRKIGIVRFNAFDDVGGEQSFAMAMLDSNRNGVIISNIYGRQDSRLYAKGIVNGETERALSDEERKALEKALAGK